MRRAPVGHASSASPAWPDTAGCPTSQAYGPTKAAQINLLESLRIDLLPRSASQVITVCPGFVRTRLTAGKHLPHAVHARARRRRPADRRRGIARGKAEIVFPLADRCWP